MPCKVRLRDHTQDVEEENTNLPKIEWICGYD
jgi:hypothetical protein